jgi:hypothetical protein
LAPPKGRKTGRCGERGSLVAIEYSRCKGRESQAMCQIVVQNSPDRDVLRRHDDRDCFYGFMSNGCVRM